MIMLNTHLFLSEAEIQSHVFSNNQEGKWQHTTVFLPKAILWTEEPDCLQSKG